MIGLEATPGIALVAPGYVLTPAPNILIYTTAQGLIAIFTMAPVL